MTPVPNPPYLKPFLDLPAQVQRLKSYGLEITNEALATKWLRRIGYYRLSGYLHLFRVPTPYVPPTRSNFFLPDSRFEDACELYIFDKKLKMLMMDAIEQVEVSVRVEVALLLGQRDPFAYADPVQLDPNFGKNSSSEGQQAYTRWMNEMNVAISRSREEFVRHYLATYSLPLPIWIAIELWDFGALSHFYSGLQVTDRAIIAQNFGIPNSILLRSWLHSLNYCRNIIAHHGRLWNRNLVVYPRLPFVGKISAFDALDRRTDVDKRLYSILCILSYLLDTINPNFNWKNRVVALANSFPAMPHAKLSDAGFPPNWKTHSFWN